MPLRVDLCIPFFLLLCLGAAPHEAPVIIPGGSVGPYELGMSYAQVKKALGKGEAEAHEFAPLRCGMRHSYMVLKYPSSGLIFNFPGKRLTSESAVSQISIVRPNEAIAPGNISLSSSREEVLAAFGIGDTSSDNLWLYYGKLGLEFEFFEQNADSVVAIHLFRPRPHTLE